ncbi:uncharacterized protein TRAVEDRAFT_124253, partial [Trametes versicolor FP-101664 SS1]|uniref:uncharacterized protein n=1 Tax=Trametes versicolor (strain FP-101664) TaxID=717944 RepID=UPI00046229E7
MWLKSYLDISPNRPRWATVADALLARAPACGSRAVDEDARINVFMQSWEVSTRAKAGLPRSLAQMIKTAKKHGVRVESPNPKRGLQDSLPVWYHLGAVPGRRTENTKANKCLRKVHAVRTVADCLAVAARLQVVAGAAGAHRSGRTCACAPCQTDREERGCPDPHACAVAARKAVDKIVQKWKPATQQDDGLSLTPTRRERNSNAAAEEGDLLFDPSISVGLPVSRAFRVFLPEGEQGTAPARRRVGAFQVPSESVTVYTDGSCNDNGCENAAAGSGAYFGEGDTRNTAARVPGRTQSNQTGEIYAVALAAAKTPPFAPLTIATD